MPAMQKLIEKLNESPPREPGELEEMLDECGYDLVMKQPSDGDVEYDEDMGPEDEEGDDLMSALSDILPPGMGAPHKNEHPHSKMRRMTVLVANKMMPKDKGGRDE